MTVYIFGDSYAARYDDHYYNGVKGELWYDILKKQIPDEIINLAQTCTGPYFSFEKFYKLVESNKISANDKIVFMLSDPYRFPYKEFSIDQQYLCPLILSKQNLPDIIDIKKHQPKILNIYETFFEEMYRHNIKNIFFLKTFSEVFNVKIIAFMCFHFNQKKLYLPQIDLAKVYQIDDINSNNFKIYNKALSDVCIEENVKRIDADNNYNMRANHLSWENHKILSNIIVNFFSGTSLTEEFAKNIIDIDVTENQSANFLYE